VLSGTDLSLHSVLNQTCTSKEWRTISLDDASVSQESQEDTEYIKHVSWNPYSPFSTGSGVLAAKKFCNKLDAVVIHVLNQHISIPFYQVTWTNIEYAIDRTLKSVFFLIREFSVQLMRQGQGLLLLAYRRLLEKEEDPLSAMIDHAIIRMGERLFDQFAYTDILFHAVHSEESSENGFAAHIMSLLESVPGRAKRWSRYNERSTMFLFRN